MTDKTIASAVEAELAVSHNPLAAIVLALLSTRDVEGTLGALTGAVDAISKARADIDGPTPLRLLPGDVVQVINPTHDRYGALAFIEQTHSWGVALLTSAGQSRAALDAVHVIGVGVLLPPDVLKARRDALGEPS